MSATGSRRGSAANLAAASQVRPNTRTAIARILGEETIEVIDWQHLMRDGVIVQLRISHWRPRAKLELADLGMTDLTSEEHRVVEVLIRLGSKKLLPESWYKDLESATRQIYRVLDRYAFDTQWGSFVPATAYMAWKAEHAEAEHALMAFRDTLIERYQEIVNELLAQYAILGQRAYRRLCQANPDRIPTDETRFVQHFCERIRCNVPPPEEIHASFAVAATLSVIPLPSQVDGEPQDSFATDVLAEQGAARERKQQLAALNREIVSSARAQKQQLVDQFLTDVISQIRGLVYTTATDVLGAIKTKGTLHPRSIARLQNLVKQVGQMNFFGDRDLDQMIADIQTFLDQPAKDRSLDEIADVLRTIATETRTSLISLGEDVREERADDGTALPLTPDEGTLREAREDEGRLDMAALMDDNQRTDREAR